MTMSHPDTDAVVRKAREDSFAEMRRLNPPKPSARARPASATPAAPAAPARKKSTLSEEDYNKMGGAERIEAGRVTRLGGVYVPHWKRDNAYVAAAYARKLAIARGQVKKEPWE